MLSIRRLSALISLALAMTPVSGEEEKSIVDLSSEIDDLVPPGEPLNARVSSILLAHSSHRSHSSHSSHRSSSGGSRSSAPRTPPATPPARRRAPATVPATPQAPKRTAAPNGAQPPRPIGSYPQPLLGAGTEATLEKQLSDKEARKNIIMRVQLTLQFKGIYNDSIDGVLGPMTREAIRKWQGLRGIGSTKYLDAETLSSLGILAF